MIQLTEYSVLEKNVRVCLPFNLSYSTNNGFKISTYVDLYRKVR